MATIPASILTRSSGPGQSAGIETRLYAVCPELTDDAFVAAPPALAELAMAMPWPRPHRIKSGKSGP